MLEEAQAIELVRAGKADAFAGIVERYQQPLIRFLYRLTGNYELARDLCQNTFMQAYKSILKTDAEISLRAWLYRIATNNAWQYHRRRKLIKFIPFVTDNHYQDAATARLDFSEDAIAVQEALLKIPESRRACLVLHLVEGFKYREIAQTIGCSEEAVRKRVSRAKQEFKGHYGGGEVR